MISFHRFDKKMVSKVRRVQLYLTVS